MSSPLERLGRRMAMALGLGRQTADTNEAASTPTLQVALADEEIRSDVPVVQQAGFRSRPLPGSDIVVLFQGGDRTRGVAIATGDQRSYPRDLQPGDVCLYHLQTDAQVWLKADGSVAISTSGKVNVSAQEAAFNCPITCTSTITAQGDIKAGNISLQQHKHPVTTAPGTSGTPE